MLGCGRGTMMHTLTLPSQARLLITVVLSGVTGWPRRRLVLCRHTPCMSRNTDGIEAANVLGHCIYVVVVSSRVLAEINLLLPLCKAPWICLLLDYSRCRQCTVSPAQHKGHATHSHTPLCILGASTARSRRNKLDPRRPALLWRLLLLLLPPPLPQSAASRPLPCRARLWRSFARRTVDGGRASSGYGE